MTKLVVNGATCVCSYGSSSATLSVSSATVEGASNDLVTVQDYTAYENVPGFSMCSSLSNPSVSSATSAASGVLTPQSCTPQLSSPWSPGSTAVKIGDDAVLLATDTLSCSYGGVISIADAGQKTVENG